MGLSRRALLGSALAGGAVLAAGSGCGTGSDSRTLTLWYWAGSISENVLDDETKRLKSQGLTLSRSAIGGDYKAKFMTTLAGRADVPSIVGMNSDVATYFPDADSFVDLRTLGSDDYADKYLEWKWKQGISPDGRMIGFPMDTGPTALYYRKDLLAKAGLPSEPDEVAASITTWDDWMAAGRTLKSKLNCLPVDSAGFLYRMVLSSATTRYFTEKNKYIGDGDTVRNAWELAVKSVKDKMSAATASMSTDWFALATNNRLPWFAGAVWMLNYLGPGVPTTKGKWRVTAAPGGAGNDGGSFLGITKYCQDPKAAFEAITWMQNADNQVRAFGDVNLFPSTPASFANPKLRKPNAFFGGQVTMDVFAPAAAKVPICYLSPYDGIVGSVYSNELMKVESQGKNPDQAWKDVQREVARELEHRGLSS